MPGPPDLTPRHDFRAYNVQLLDNVYRCQGKVYEAPARTINTDALQVLFRRAFPALRRGESVVTRHNRILPHSFLGLRTIPSVRYYLNTVREYTGRNRDNVVEHVFVQRWDGGQGGGIQREVYEHVGKERVVWQIAPPTGARHLERKWVIGIARNLRFDIRQGMTTDMFLPDARRRARETDVFMIFVATTDEGILQGEWAMCQDIVGTLDRIAQSCGMIPSYDAVLLVSEATRAPPGGYPVMGRYARGGRH